MEYFNRNWSIFTWKIRTVSLAIFILQRSNNGQCFRISNLRRRQLWSMHTAETCLLLKCKYMFVRRVSDWKRFNLSKIQELYYNIIQSTISSVAICCRLYFQQLCWFTKLLKNTRRDLFSSKLLLLVDSMPKYALDMLSCLFTFISNT